MKRISFLLLLIISLYGCKRNSTNVDVSGEITGLGTDTLYLYGMDGGYDKIDTIYVENDEFSFTIKTDTVSPITPVYLLIKNRIEYPLFLEKGNSIKIKGDTTNLNLLTIEGNSYNEDFTNFQKAIAELPSPTEKAKEDKAEEYITQHPSSYVNLYLLNKYFAGKEQPDYKRIQKLIDSMTGELLDNPIIEKITEDIKQADKLKTGNYAPFFSIPNAKGEKITRTAKDLNNKCLLINFWASWNDSTSLKASNKELRSIYKEYKNNKYFGMIGISLDVDKKQWKDAIKRDTLSWEQVCDFGGLNSDVANQFSIQNLPSNILLSTNGMIVAKNLQGDELKKEIKKVIDEKIESEKADKTNKTKNK